MSESLGRTSISATWSCVTVEQWLDLSEPWILFCSTEVTIVPNYRDLSEIS